MDNNTKELLSDAGRVVKDVCLGLVKLTFGTLKYASQGIIDLCDGACSKKEDSASCKTSVQKKHDA